ncbi:hypothetical protein EI94DRAFT_1702690 [Lactarius quietus]|nr:hypothetical protein EI94DRAFT_1702690 [Lactarius quietus]
MTLHPTSKAVSFKTLAEKYGAVEFQDALADYIAGINNPGASAANLQGRAADTLIPFRTVPVYHRIKFVSSGNSDDTKIIDSIQVRPEYVDTQGRIVPARFDTVLVRGTQDVICGNNGHWIAQLRAVFQIPRHLVDDIFPGTKAPTHLASVGPQPPIAQGVKIDARWQAACNSDSSGFYTRERSPTSTLWFYSSQLD